MMLNSGTLVSTHGWIVARGCCRLLAGRSTYRDDASIQRLHGAGDLVVALGGQHLSAEDAQFEQMAALLLEEGNVLALLDVVRAGQAVVPLAGNADAVAPGSFLVGGRHELPHVDWCRSADRLGRVHQAFDRVAELTREMVRPFDEE